MRPGRLLKSHWKMSARYYLTRKFSTVVPSVCFAWISVWLRSSEIVNTFRLFKTILDDLRAGLKRMQNKSVFFFSFQISLLVCTNQTNLHSILYNSNVIATRNSIIRQTRDGAPYGPMIPRKRTEMQPTCYGVQQAKKLPLVHLRT
jgi:hypothetical protein